MDLFKKTLSFTIGKEKKAEDLFTEEQLKVIEKLVKLREAKAKMEELERHSAVLPIHYLSRQLKRLMKDYKNAENMYSEKEYDDIPTVAIQVRSAG